MPLRRPARPIGEVECRRSRTGSQLVAPREQNKLSLLEIELLSQAALLYQSSVNYADI
jgi:hypothetical protein